MANVLVTGASGFIGPRLIPRLQRAGHEVTCLVRATSDTSRIEPLGVRLVRGDVTDRESLSPALVGIDYVVHLAGRTHARKLEDYLAVNEAGTENLLAACARQESPPRVVMTSSLAAAGPSPPGRPHTEETPPAPISLYGKSKLAAELAARQYADRVPLAILRPPVVFGPGDRDGLALFRAIRLTRLHPVPQRKGLPLTLIYSDDLADALTWGLSQGERVASFDEANPHDPRGLYYVGDDAVSSWEDAGRMAAAALGVRVLVLRFRKYPFLIPALVGDAVGAITGKPSLLGIDKLREASASGWVCSSEKAKAQLRFACEKPLAERYLETCEWYKSEGWL